MPFVLEDTYFKMIFILGRYFKMIDVPPDGSCLFSAISYSIYGDIDHGQMIRKEVVDIVCGNWDRFRILTDKGGNEPFGTVEEYSK